ncbi:hypothetical protein ABK040_012350 [Willaertia magna]
MGLNASRSSDGFLSKLLSEEHDDNAIFNNNGTGATTTNTTTNNNNNGKVKDRFRRKGSTTGNSNGSTTPKVGDAFVDLGHMLAIDTYYHGYVIQQLIGKGSYGEVYLATKNKQEYALKVIELPKTTDKETIENIEREVKILKNLTHPNIMQFVEEFPLKDQFDRNCVGVVTEFCPKGTIGDIIEKDEHVDLNLWRIIYWFVQLVDAISYCHDNAIIHRDIKPSNMLLMNDDSLKLCDFGLAKMLTKNNNVTYTICGTPLYVAVEIQLQRPYTYSCDIYSLGLCLFELTCHQKHDIFYRAVLRERERIAELFERIDLPSLKELIRKMVEANPDLRISSKNLNNHYYIKGFRYLTLPNTDNENNIDKKDLLHPLFLNIIKEAIVYESKTAKEKTFNVIERCLNYLDNYIMEFDLITNLLREEYFFFSFMGLLLNNNCLMKMFSILIKFINLGESNRKCSIKCLTQLIEHCNVEDTKNNGLVKELLNLLMDASKEFKVEMEKELEKKDVAIL